LATEKEKAMQRERDAKKQANQEEEKDAKKKIVGLFALGKKLLASQ